MESGTTFVLLFQYFLLESVNGFQKESVFSIQFWGAYYPVNTKSQRFGESTYTKNFGINCDIYIIIVVVDISMLPDRQNSKRNSHQGKKVNFLFFL